MVYRHDHRLSGLQNILLNRILWLTSVRCLPRNALHSQKIGACRSNPSKVADSCSILGDDRIDWMSSIKTFSAMPGQIIYSSSPSIVPRQRRAPQKQACSRFAALV